MLLKDEGSLPSLRSILLLTKTESMRKYPISKVLTLSVIAISLSACSDDKTNGSENNNGNQNATFDASEWYPGGELGTTENTTAGCYQDESPAVEEAGLLKEFNYGEAFFERNYTLNTKPFKGLGPCWVRPSCIYCHPGYGHGKKQYKYEANTMGNGYLLALFYPAGSSDGKGGAYSEDTYVTEIAGVPQTKAQTPFLPPIDESGIHIEWKKATDEHGNKFADGETYELSYPEVTIYEAAIHTSPKPRAGYTVRLESTIGIQGTALIDAIPDDSLKKQYAHEAQFAKLNPMMWDADKNDWASTAFMNLEGRGNVVRRFNYQLSRSSLQQDYAIWEICNVTRKDLHYLYTTKEWAKANSEDEKVIDYIQQHGKDDKLLNPYYGDGTRENIKYLVNLLLGLNSPEDAPTYEKYFVDKFGEEMEDQNYYNFMVWQRGLAVPKARNLDDEQVKQGKQIFMRIGCANCHRPSWTTGKDDYWATSFVKGMGKMPTYPYQKIYPYSDFVQHRLYMENDIINGWCRTTPLWGRGLSVANTGAEDRLHDCRAKNEIEAIMWHGYSKNSDAYFATQNFYKLSKAERDAVVKFIRSI